MIRLQKFLSEAGVASRRKAEELVLEGRVKVNGEVVQELGIKIDPKKDTILVDGKTLRPEEKVYYLLNKPAGYTTTVKDPHAKRTVLELAPKEPRVFPVGRLDKATTGLLILTNDGELSYLLTHPSHEKEKEYVAACSRQLTASNIKKLENGILLEEGLTMPAKIKTLKKGPEHFFYSVTLTEGKKRQVRRMFEKVGNPVVRLKRIRIDDLNLGDLKEGEWRRLFHFEIDKLYGRRHNEKHP